MLTVSRTDARVRSMSWLKFSADPNPQEMQMGKEVEKEHTATIKWLIGELGGAEGKREQELIGQTVEKIASDHLSELPDYYTRLQKMEGEAGS
jgi:hypothetical protein